MPSPRPAPAAVVGVGATDQFQQEWNQQAAPGQAAWEQEPIIQDGWQWDHAAQEWKPLEQWQPPAPPAHAAPTEAAPAQAAPTQGTEPTRSTPIQPAPPVPPVEQPQQPDEGPETTQFRPPQ